MRPSMLAVAGPSPLWYLTRGTGLVTLILLTASVALGVANISRWARPAWPRFATAGLHRNVSLLVVVVLAVHILTAELDTFAPIGWLAVVVPFASSYRPIWLGLGTVAFDLIVALTVTSLLRDRLGYRTWRAIHWVAYLSWPVALVHGTGTGTDSRLGWAQVLTVACVAAVIVAVAWRLAHGWPARLGPRLTGGLAAALALVVMALWAVTGPLRPGWAKRAGTPSALLATVPASTSPSPGAAPGAVTAPSPSSPSATGSIPPPPFAAVLAGTLTQRGPGTAGQVTVTITTRVSGGATGALDIVLEGRSAGGGVSLQTSTVTFGPTSAPSQYRGRVVALNGSQLVASVRANTGPALNLGISLQIDPATGSVHGSAHAQAATSSSGGGK